MGSDGVVFSAGVLVSAGVVTTGVVAGVVVALGVVESVVGPVVAVGAAGEMATLVPAATGATWLAVEEAVPVCDAVGRRTDVDGEDDVAVAVEPSVAGAVHPSPTSERVCSGTREALVAVPTADWVVA